MYKLYETLRWVVNYTNDNALYWYVDRRFSVSDYEIELYLGRIEGGFELI